MKKNFSLSDIENLIINKFREKDALSFVTNDVINNIINKVKSELQSKLNSNTDTNLEEVENTLEVPEKEEEAQTIQVNTPPANQNPNISVQTTIDPEKEEIIKKETEIEIKEKELEQKEEDLIHQEINFKEQQEELEYRPELPKALSEIDPNSSLIIFNNGDISLGSTALSNKKFPL